MGRFNDMTREQAVAILEDYERRLDWSSTCRGCVDRLNKSYAAYMSDEVERERFFREELAQQNSEQSNLLALWLEYYKLLKAEFDSLVSVAWVHGWKPNLTGRQMHRAEELRKLLGVE